MEEPQMRFGWEANDEEIIEEQTLSHLGVAEDGTTILEWPGGIHPAAILRLNGNYDLPAAGLTQLFRIIDDPSFGLRREEIAPQLGLPGVRVDSLIKHASAMCLLDSASLQITSLGRIFLKVDPLFEDPGGQWLLHYLIASNPRHTIWNYLFNVLFQSNREMSMADIRSEFQIFISRWAKISLNKNLRQEVRAIRNTYTHGLLRKIRLVDDGPEATVGIALRPALIDDQVLLATILIFRDRFFAGAHTLDIGLLEDYPNSPGRLLFLDRRRLTIALDNLHNGGLITIETRADLNQIRLKTGPTWLSVFKAHMAEKQYD